MQYPVSVKLPKKEDPRRVLYNKSRPCFHCSKSLQQLGSASKDRGKYVGFVLTIDGIERDFHLSCIDMFREGVRPETDFKSEEPPESWLYDED